MAHARNLSKQTTESIVKQSLAIRKIHTHTHTVTKDWVSYQLSLGHDFPMDTDDKNQPHTIDKMPTMTSMYNSVVCAEFSLTLPCYSFVLGGFRAVFLALCMWITLSRALGPICGDQNNGSHSQNIEIQGHTHIINRSID